MPDHVLVAEGLVSQADVERARILRAERGGTIGAQLIGLGVIEEQTLARGLARGLGVQLLRREGLEGIPEDVLALLPTELAQAHRAVPLRRDQRGVLVAMADPSDDQAVAAVRAAISVPVEAAVAPESAIDWAVGRYYGTADAGVILLTRRKETSEADARSGPRDTDEQEAFDGPPTEEMWGILADGAKTIEMRTPMAWRRGPSGEDPTAAAAEPAPSEEVIVLDKPKRSTPAESPAAAAPPGSRPARPTPRRAGLSRTPSGGEAGDLDHRPTSVFHVVRRERPTEPSDQPPPSMRFAGVSGKPDAGAAAEPTDEVPPQEEGDAEDGRGRRRRRTTIPGMPAFRTDPARPPGIERVRTTERTDREPPRAAPKDIRVALEQTVAALRECNALDALAQTALRFVGQVCRRRALLEIAEGELVGWAAAGEGFSSADVKSLRVAIEISSVFGAVAHSRIPYQGPLLFGPEERAFAEVVGNHPGEIILVPVIAAGDVVALIYGDGLLGHGQLALLRELAAEIGTALVRARKL